MKSSILFVATLGTSFSHGYLVAPPGPALPNTIAECSGWKLIASGDSCASLEAAYAITENQLLTYVSIPLLLLHFRLISLYNVNVLALCVLLILNNYAFTYCSRTLSSPRVHHVQLLQALPPVCKSTSAVQSPQRLLSPLLLSQCPPPQIPETVLQPL